MEVHFTPEQEARLAQLASKEGTDAEHLLKDAALRLLDDETSLQSFANPRGAASLRVDPSLRSG
jgi:hypothetical protein